MWRMAHRLELAIKDALKGTSFDLVNEISLCLDHDQENSCASGPMLNTFLGVLVFLISLYHVPFYLKPCKMMT